MDKFVNSMVMLVTLLLTMAILFILIIGCTCITVELTDLKNAFEGTTMDFRHVFVWLFSLL
jgi:hypothetical protein